MQRLGGSSCNQAETQRPKLGLDGLANNPSFRTKRMHEGHTKKTGKLLIALSLCVEAWGLFLQPSRDPVTQTHTGGLSKQPLLPNEKDVRGSHKKDRETPDRPLALSRGSGALPATRSKTSNPNSHSHSGARQNAIKGIEPIMAQGFEGWAPEGLDSHPRTNRVRNDYGRAHTWPRPKQAIA